MISAALLAAIPKTDLHLHLDGSLRLQTLLELAASGGVDLPSQSVEGMNDLVFKESYADLGEYLRGFQYTVAVLQTSENLERAAYELAWDNLNEGVCYIEVRFAPQLHMHSGLSFDQVVLAVNAGLQLAQTEHESALSDGSRKGPPFRYGIIVCAMRMFASAFSEWFDRLCGAFPNAPLTEVYGLASLELARAAVRCRDQQGVPIVGFDLAGQEDGYPAKDHREAYSFAHRHFLNKTVHAGEAYGPESIFEAITELYADRIGHGYHLFATDLCGPAVSDPHAYVQALAQYIADRRVTIEVCITSNLQTNPALNSVKDHVLGRMMAARLSVTLCTDNRLMSHTSVTRELGLAIEAFSLNDRDLRNLVIYGFKRSFFPGSYREKRSYVRGVIDHYDAIRGESVVG